VRARCSFRMILHAEQRQRLVAQAFQRLIIQVNVRELDLVGVDGIRIDGKVVIVRRDLNLARRIVAHRVVAAMVPKLQLEGLTP